MRLVFSYVRALALGCFYSHISTRTFRRALHDRVAGQLRGDKECPFSGVTKSGRVWRKVPEGDARSVLSDLTPSCPLSSQCPAAPTGQKGSACTAVAVECQDLQAPWTATTSASKTATPSAAPTTRRWRSVAVVRWSHRWSWWRGSSR